jgi:phosphohistidine phosphatase
MASRDDIAVPDSERPLTPQGRRESAAAVAKFKSLGYPDGAVVTSPARRAQETADIWQKELAVPAEHLRTVPEIYEAERADMLRVVRHLDDAADRVILVGHNPGVTALLHYLAGRGVEQMSPASFAVISIAVDSWRRISLRDSELAHYYAPPPDAKFNSLWQRFVLWRRQRVQKVELFIAFLIGLALILGLVAVLIATGGGAE